MRSVIAIGHDKLFAFNDRQLLHHYTRKWFEGGTRRTTTFLAMAIQSVCEFVGNFVRHRATHTLPLQHLTHAISYPVLLVGYLNLQSK